MFEKEAEELIEESKRLNTTPRETVCKAIEFGYNKCKEEINKNGLALQLDMDRTIEQNFALKAQIKKMTDTETMLKILKDRGVIRSWYYNGTYHV